MQWEKSFCSLIVSDGVYSFFIYLWLPVSTNASLFEMAVSILPYYSGWWIQGQVWSQSQKSLFSSSAISRLLPINLKKVNKLTTPGGKKRLLISSQRLWNGFAHKTPGFFSDLQRPCLSHEAVYHFMGGGEEFYHEKCYVISQCDII